VLTRSGGGEPGWKTLRACWLGMGGRALYSYSAGLRPSAAPVRPMPAAGSKVSTRSPRPQPSTTEAAMAGSTLGTDPRRPRTEVAAGLAPAGR